MVRIPDWLRIIIHHSLTRDSGTVSWGAIRRFHTKECGMLDIGYHAGVEDARGEYECFYGRPITRTGAHARGNNYGSLGFCFVGNFDKQEPTIEQMMVAARRVIVPWMIEFDIPVEKVIPHRAVSDKSCPGKLFDMDELRRIISTLHPVA